MIDDLDVWAQWARRQRRYDAIWDTVEWLALWAVVLALAYAVLLLARVAA